MSPFFGHKEEGQPTDTALLAEVDRLDALTPAQLAAEVMAKGFGPGAAGADEAGTVTIGGPNTDAGLTASDLALDFAPGGSTRGADDQLRLRLQRLVAEGMQTLEHASLIRPQMHTAMGEIDYAITRRGRAAVAGNAVERAIGGEAI